MPKLEQEDEIFHVLYVHYYTNIENYTVFTFLNEIKMLIFEWT